MSSQPQQSPGKPMVFISYARRDSHFADSIEGLVSGQGVATWIDRQRLAGGQEWPSGLVEAIDRCDALILILSPAALASEAVQREYRYALEHGKRIVPVLLRRVSALPSELAGLHWVDFTRDAGPYDLIYALHATGLACARPASPGGLDPTLALALALHNQAPDGWWVQRVARGRYVLPMLRTGSGAFLAVAVLLAIGLALISAGPMTPVTIQYASLLELSGTLWQACVIGAGVALVWGVQCGYRCAIYSRLYRGTLLPEILVLAPEGVVARQLTLSLHARLPLSIAFCPFKWADAITSKRRWLGGRTLPIRWTAGYARAVKPLRLLLSARYANTNGLASQIVTSFQLHQLRSGSTRAGAAPARITMNETK